ncbi:hypothetical protein L1987_52752 [Smallanthus sonchifolius]|uniref:Uncharacterized protein n=1 Tax=Smallanthus sonchifolius TaxID=185202 RepID=A0ACB9EUB3_9ASTR|nr:hypothetical protein L1987_52752 [Smallanthus sonchifolius]
MKHINSKGGRKIEDGDGKNTMKNPEVVELEVDIKKLEYEIKSLKDEVETSKLRENTLEKENKYIKSERYMAMQRNEDLENMLKQLKLERDIQEDIKNLCNDELETKSVKKADAKQIEEWNFIYKTNRFYIKRRNGSIFYLNSIKEVLDLLIGDLKQMIHLKEVGRDISSKESDTILCMKKFIFDDEKMQPHYDHTPNTYTFEKSKEKCDKIQTFRKISSQKSHDVSHDDDPVYDETPQTISSVINKDAKLDSKECNEEKVEGKIFGKMSFDPPSFKLISQLTLEGYKEAKPMQNETEEDS